jgi:enolase
MEITDAKATQVLDSRGNPTVHVELYHHNVSATAKVPSGASTGQYEAVELRDRQEAYQGKTVHHAVKHVNTTIRSAIQNRSFTDQEGFDETLLDLDGTDNKERLGANAILGCSMAYARLEAKVNGHQLYEELTSAPRLPTPYANILNGGDHAGNNLAIQEFMIAPVGADTFTEATQIIAETYHVLKNILRETYGAEATNVGDEGGFAPPLETSKEALDLIMQAVEQAGYVDQVKIAIDAAANEFYDAETELYAVDGDEKTTEELTEYYQELIEAYPVASLEDPFNDDDFEAYASLLDAVNTCQIVGDDLTVTNPARVDKAIDMKSANALLLKVNQIGTVSEARRAAELAMEAGWNVMVSHRSGETEDAFIADFAVGIGATQAKIGAPCRGERTAKYNRFLLIENGL